MTVGEKIRRIRTEQGILADDLADQLGVSRSTMFRYESGQIKKIPMDILSRIADALHTTPGKLAGWDTRDDEFTKAFRQAVANLIESADPEDIKAAGIDLEEMNSIINGSSPIPLEKAFRVADDLGVSMDEILGRVPTAPIVGEDERRYREYFELFSRLSLEHQNVLIQTARALLQAQEQQNGSRQ